MVAVDHTPIVLQLRQAFLVRGRKQHETYRKWIVVLQIYVARHTTSFCPRDLTFAQLNIKDKSHAIPIDDFDI